MNDNIEPEAEQLDDFITARLSGPGGLADEGSRDETELAGALIALAESELPDPAFAQKLERQLVSDARWNAASGRAAPAPRPESSTKKAQPRRQPIVHLPSPLHPSRRWFAGGLAATALAAVVIAFLLMGPAPVANAQEILEKAKAVADSPSATGIQSLELQETVVAQISESEVMHSTISRWFEAPGRWRVEVQSKVTDPKGQDLPGRSSASVSVTDGTTVWYLDQKQNAFTITPLPPNVRGTANLTDFGPQPESLNALFAQASSCFDPRLQGTATVAGRTSYVVDLGIMRCAGVSASEAQGRSIIWVDEQTFLVLKHVQYSASGNAPLASTEVTNVRYNTSLDPSFFSLMPPSGATVQDFRPKPAPTGEQFRQQIQALAKLSAFPLFAPDYVPLGLMPRQPRANTDGDIELEYVPMEQVDRLSAAILNGLLINEQQATYDLVVKSTEGARPLQIPNGQAWLRTDAPNPVGGGEDKAAYVLRDGTLISIASFKIEATELVKVASALQPVPGAHAPLPNPTPPLLVRVRQSVSFPVFVPTYVPAGLTAEPPSGGSGSGSSVAIQYHAVNGAIALTVINGPQGCCSDLRAIKGETITVSKGVEAYLVLDAGENIGSWTLWWEQDGTVIQLNGPDMTRADLIKIAASLSPAAELGRTEVPPVRPTPSPLPAPNFKILLPRWLPEPLTVQQDYQKAPPEFGSWAVVNFLPEGTDQPRTPLLLFEKPRGLATFSSSAPATQQKIGSYDVAVVRTARECSSYDWDVGDVHLSLRNAYNSSGAARYTCDQMTRIVESIR